jgi:hypothetical protein
MIGWKCMTGFLNQANDAGERARQWRDRKRESVRQGIAINDR